jgi:hypothetical protein
MTVYAASFSNVSVTAQQDFFEISAPATGIVIIHRCLISQTSDVGDAAEEGLLILLKRNQTTSGSGGTTVTPAAGGAMENSGPAFSGVVEANNTTKAGTGTISTLHAEAWNVRQVFDFLPTPEMRPVLSPSQRATFELATTPADALSVSGVLQFEWLGG